MYTIVTDQMGIEVKVPHYPRRIISLVPSQTELLFDLGLGAGIVGLTRFCTHPFDQVQNKQRIGGTKDFDIDKIIALKPDLIIGNKEENYEDGIIELKKHFPVWMSDIVTQEDAYDMMRKVGEITARQERAHQIVEEIRESLLTLAPLAGQQPGISCAYFIWRKPYMVAASGTFINEMLRTFGVKNAFGDQERYPEVTAEAIAAHSPGLIFLSSEPYAFTSRHIAEFQQICPTASIHIVDGEMFSWYGSRLRHTAGYFRLLQSGVL